MDPHVAVPRRVRSALGLPDRVFRVVAQGSGLVVLVVMGAVGLFLLLRGSQAIRAAGWKFLTTQAWDTDTHHFGVAALLTGTALIAGVAICISVPLALGTALYLSEFARGGWQRFCVALADLMAAVPSVLYGLWGLFALQGQVVGLAQWISTWFGWIPIFRVDGADPTNPLATPTVYTSSTLIAGITVALMVAPVQCAVMREAFNQAPVGEREGAYALGATRWGMITSVVLPFGRGGIIGGTMLGLGRALGETIAVYMIISPVFVIQPHILQNGAISVSSLIALRFNEASGFALSALMAAGLALFIVTLIVNFIASSIVARSRSGAQSEG